MRCRVKLWRQNSGVFQLSLKLILRAGSDLEKMVRTKASNAAPAATRKAVAARAPRKSVGTPRPVTSPSSSGRSKKGKSVVGGNPAKLWGTPEWQKGIGSFLKSADGCSSSSLVLDPDQSPGPSSSEMTGESSEAMVSSSSATTSGGVAILDSSIAQLNSDDEDSD